MTHWTVWGQCTRCRVCFRCTSGWRSVKKCSASLPMLMSLAWPSSRTRSLMSSGRKWWACISSMWLVDWLACLPCDWYQCDGHWQPLTVHDCTVSFFCFGAGILLILFSRAVVGAIVPSFLLLCVSTLASPPPPPLPPWTLSFCRSLLCQHFRSLLQAQLLTAGWQLTVCYRRSPIPLL